MEFSERFPTTRWTLVLSAGDSAEEGRSALATLCESYWYPLYAYARRRGYAIDQAEELTQEFFVRLLQKRYLDRADPQKCRFRAFLLASFKYFLFDEHDRRTALKRGGKEQGLPFGIHSGEELYRRELSHNETPEKIFERAWALKVLGRVVMRLGTEFARKNDAAHFDKLRMFLLSAGDIPYASLAAELQTSEGALKVAIHRLRKRYRELLRAEIGETVSSSEEIEDEIRYLVSALAQC
jgi:RNA polymerase sigma-70 factor (ECF subfamily)